MRVRWDAVTYHCWRAADNLGDGALNDWLVPRLFRKLVAPPTAPPQAVLYVCGSTLHYPHPHGHAPWLICGAGYQENYGPWAVPRGALAFAVRGPLTLGLLEANNPDALVHGHGCAQGDPALLAPLLLPRSIAASRGTATVHKFDWSGGWTPDTFTTRTRDVEHWCRKLWQYRRVRADSLHAALLADTYGIPWLPLRWEPKWQDAFLSLGIDRRPDAYTLSDRRRLREAQDGLLAAVARLTAAIGGPSSSP